MERTPERQPVDVYHAISDSNRRKLLDLLLEKERAVQEFQPHLKITLGAISQHLQVLRRSGLVTREKRGRHRYYRLNAQALAEVHAWTRRYQQFWAESLDRLGDYLDGQP